MPTKEELSEQLAVTQKLTALVDQMAKSQSRVEQSYTSQIDAIEKLTRAIQLLKGQDLSTLNNLKLDNLQKEMKDTEKSSTALTSRIKDMGNQMAKKLPSNAAAGAAALSGFVQGVRNVIAMGKGVTGFFGGLVGWVGSLTAAIFSIPFQIFGKLVSAAAGAGGGMNELMQAIENLRKEMGDLKGPASSAVMDTTKTLKGFSDTGLSAWRVFGTLAERLEFITKDAVAMGATFGQLRKEFVENGGALLAFQKGLGVSEEGMKAIGDRAITMGKPMTKTFMDMTKQTLALGKAFDIDQKLIGKDMTKAMLDVKHFGAMTVKEIGQASIYARKLGLELDKITGTLDAFETFDSAADNAAKLSQSFGVTVDAFKLMEAQSPAEQMDMLRKSFREAGVDASKFTRQQAKLLATTTGLDEATVRQAFSSKNYGVSLDEVKKKSEAAEKKTMTQAEAMSKLADSIERMVKSGVTQEGGFFKMFVKGMSAGIQSSKEFREIIFNIKRALQTVYFEGVRLGREVVKLFPGLQELMKGMGDFFKPGKFKALARGVSDEFIVWMKDLTSPGGRASFPDLMKRLQDKFFSFFDKESPSGKRMLEGFKTVFTTLGKIAADGLRWMADKMAESLKFITDMIQNPQKLSNLAKSGQGGLGFLAGVIEPIVESLKHAWKVVAPAAFDLLKVVGKKIMNFLKSDEFMSLIRPALPFIAAAFFGPMLGRTLLSTLTTTLLKNVLSGGGMGLIKKAMSSLSGKVIGGVAEGAGSKALGAAGPIGMLVAAGAAVGHGVNKYTESVTSTIDHSTKVIAAGATGLIDALTFGLLPDDLMTTLANTFGQVGDMIFGAMESVFGKGFTDSMKRKMAAEFELLGSIYNFIAQLFTGDQDSFTKSAKEMGLAVLRFLVSTLEDVFVQLPLFLSRMSMKVLTLASEAIIKIIFAVVGTITGAVDSVFGTELTAKVNKASDAVRQGIEKAGDAINTGMSNVSDKIAKSSGEMQDKYLRTAEDQAKIAKQAANKIGASQASATADAHKTVEKSLSGTLSDINAAKDIQAQLTGPNAVDLKKLISDVKSKIGDVDFKILSTEQATELNKTGQLTDALKGTVDNITGFFSSFSKLPDVIKNATAALKKDAIRPALEAVDNMVDLANKLDSALSDGNLNKVDVKSKLSRVANSLGLGAKAQYTVKNKDVVITVNLNVSMNVDEVEKVLIMRKSSIIRDRLNFATTGDTAGQRGTPEIPESYTPVLQSINKSGS